MRRHSRRSRWLAAGALALMVAGCGGGDSPTSATPPTPSFAGTWAGAGQVQQCTGNTTVCAGAGNSTAPIEFVLTQTGTAVTGSFTVNGAEPRVPITGSVASDGSLNLSGRQTNPPVTLDSTRLTAAGTAMSGTLTYSLPGPTQAPITLTLGLQGVTRR